MKEITDYNYHRHSFIRARYRLRKYIRNGNHKLAKAEYFKAKMHHAKLKLNKQHNS